MPAHSRFSLLLVVSFSLVIGSCGNSSSKPAAKPPIFTSTPTATAAQGAAYTYQLAAADPSGGTVSFALTTGPTGASLSGSTLTWTPTAAQSRVSNSFTVTATTSEGGTAEQSWSVSPTGIVTVSWINNYWEPSGEVQVPVVPAASLEVSAVVPEPDGSITVLKGASTGSGVISIAGVPAGNYWMAFGGAELLPDSTSAYWTNSSTFDAGRNFAGSPTPTVSGPATLTKFDFSLSGLDAVGVPTPVPFNPVIQGLSLTLMSQANATSLSETAGDDGDIDWTQVSTAFLTQYEPATFGPLTGAVLGPSAMLSNLSLTNGATNTITQALQSAAAPTSLSLTVQGSQWAASLAGTGPATPSSFASGFTNVAEPFVSGVNAPGALRGSSLVLAATVTTPTGLPFSFSEFAACDGTGFLGTAAANPQPPITTDQSLGTLQYSDPFPSAWTRAETFCEEAVVPIPIPNTTATENFALVTSASAAPSNSALVPIVGPVQSPTINGGSLFTAATLNTATPSLSWSAPAAGSPFGYRVAAFVQTVSGSIPVYATAGVFFTSQTSVTLPPLSGGNTYVFAITAEVDGTANVQTAPFRSSLPTGFSSVVSAPITISAGATQPAIHGDARVLKRFSQPRVRSGPR
jgi:hypothetical protein